MKQTFASVAFQGAVVRRSLLIAAVVGSILIAINHGSCIMAGEFGSTCALKSGLTLLVPYCVSTISSVLTCADQKDRA